MAQAKTLTTAELDQVLRYVSTKKYAQRDRALILTSFWSGMRVGEIAALTMADVVNDDGTIKKLSLSLASYSLSYKPILLHAIRSCRTCRSFIAPIV